MKHKLFKEKCLEMPLLYIAIETSFDNGGKVSIAHLQRSLALGFTRAKEIVDAIESCDMCGPWNGTVPRWLSMSRKSWNSIKKEFGITPQDAIAERDGKEIWKKIPGYEGRYDVSNKGRVRSWIWGLTEKHVSVCVQSTPNIIPPTTDKKGYLTVTLRSLGGSRTIRRVHKLVLVAFIGPRSRSNKGMFCGAAHGDGNRENNELSNLRWASAKENYEDSVLHGTACQGDKHGCAKLSTNDVIQIRTTLSGECTKDLAVRFNVTTSAINRIRNGSGWKSVCVHPVRNEESAERVARGGVPQSELDKIKENGNEQLL